MQKLEILVKGAGKRRQTCGPEALGKGHAVRALLWDVALTARLPAVEVVVGNVTKPETILAALEGSMPSS